VSDVVAALVFELAHVPDDSSPVEALESDSLSLVPVAPSPPLLVDSPHPNPSTMPSVETRSHHRAIGFMVAALALLRDRYR